ncbi:coenzyme F420-0:L-glutamate ligase [Streptomyces marispadix]|uniref:Bifunctional F420 biosynthesis protein FbiB n=1 Tax=Streptomyces marispadix TaxID=2922868 RepID=A0ABS9SWG3_9ACTN|nr:coenzyme F420-0:L-glutamate ligase [Streptomyces marispadix]MCH6160627.1 coenzyme F420-0:L-glutamate ligase [Streptomyces marispadix]
MTAHGGADGGRERTGSASAPAYRVWALPGIPEVRPGDDLVKLIVDAVISTAAGTGTGAATAVPANGAALAASSENGDPPAGLADGDVLIVTSKIVSKAEGRIVRADDREAAIEAETVRVVARRGPARIVESRHGFVMAAAGVDASNTPKGTVLLLPEDPDASARRIREGVRDALGADVGVVVTDTFGRPWREGQTDVAIGAAGVRVLEDLRGGVDTFGNPLGVTVTAVGDELAAAGELVKGKADGFPVAVVRGLPRHVLDHAAVGRGADDHGGDPRGSGPLPAGSARALVRDAAHDMFRLGTSEAVREALGLRRTVREFTSDPVDGGAVRRAVEAAVTAPAPHHTTPWRFVLLESPEARLGLLDAMREQWIEDLRADGKSEESIAKRVRRGDVLRNAPYLVVPCLVADGSHDYPDARRSAAEREMFVVACGAGIQNFLVALAGEQLGSAWVSSTMFCRDVVRRELKLPGDWDPMGAVAVGRAAAPPRQRPPRGSGDFIEVR